LWRVSSTKSPISSSLTPRMTTTFTYTKLSVKHLFKPQPENLALSPRRQHYTLLDGVAYDRNLFLLMVFCAKLWQETQGNQGRQMQQPGGSETLQATLTGSKPRLRARSRVSSTRSWPRRRVICSKRSGLSVSRLKFSRLSPA